MARVRLAFLTAFLLTVTRTTFAHAQHCRPASTDHALGQVDANLRAEGATFSTARYEGSYEGLLLGGGFQVSRFAFRAQLPRYRILRNGRAQQGYGDLLGEAELRLHRFSEASARLGVALSMTAPTGSRRADLGMGHFMWMPGVWADLTSKRFLLQAKLSYAGVLGSEASPGGHAHGPGPIVAPMNTSELGGLLSGSMRVYDVLHARVGVLTGLALNPEGTSRATALVGSDFVFQRLRFTLEAELPLAGDPFSFKLASEAGIRF